MEHERSKAPIRRTVKASKTPRGVKKGTKRGKYESSKKRDPAKPRAGARPPAYTHLSLVPDDLLERAKYKAGFVSEYVLMGCPRGMLIPMAAAHARRLAREMKVDSVEVPNDQTLYDWKRQYQEYGILGLVDTPSPFAGTSRVLTLEQQHLIGPALAAQVGYAGVTALIVRETPRDEKAPSASTVYRATVRFEKRHPHLMTAIRKGTLVLGDTARIALSHGVLPGAFRLAVDSTVADIWVRVPDRYKTSKWEVYRPVLTMIQDVGTRMIVTFNLSLEPVTADILCGTFLRAVCQEHNYPGLISTGVPLEVALDQGSEHQGRFRDVLDSMKIRVLEGVPNKPRGRARLERAIRTITSELLHRLNGGTKGWTVFDPYAPAELDSKRTASRLQYDRPKVEIDVENLLTIDALERHIVAWIRAYNRRPHPSLRADDEELQQVIALYGATSPNTMNQGRAA